MINEEKDQSPGLQSIKDSIRECKEGRFSSFAETGRGEKKREQVS